MRSAGKSLGMGGSSKASENREPPHMSNVLLSHFCQVPEKTTRGCCRFELIVGVIFYIFFLIDLYYLIRVACLYFIESNSSINFVSPSNLSSSLR